MKATINWPQAAAEVSLILIGLLFAFSADRLWEARQEEAAEQAYLARLRDDFSAVRSHLYDAINEQEDIVAAQRSVLAVLASGDPQQFTEQLPDLLPSAFDGGGINVVTSTYDELESTGQLGLLDSGLRSALTRFDAMARGSLTRTEAIQNEMWVHRTQPFLDAHLTPDVYVPDDDRDSMAIPSSPFSVNWADSAMRRELWNLVSHRIIFFSIRERVIRDLLGITDEVLGQIERATADHSQ